MAFVGDVVDIASFRSGGAARDSQRRCGLVRVTNVGNGRQLRQWRRGVRMGTADDGEGEKKSDGGGGGKPDDKRLVQALELSYVGVWVSLGTKGVGEDYMNALKGFIMATVAAYERGYTLSAVLLELQINSSFAENARKLGLSEEQISNASLSDSDKKTREYWLLLVYLTLSYLRHTPPSPPLPPPADPQKLEQLVRFVTDQYKRGFSLDGIKLEQSLNASAPSAATGSSADPRAAQMSRAQASIRSQWMRIVFMTCEIVIPR